MSESSFDREALAKEIREELGDYNDDKTPVILLVRRVVQRLNETEKEIKNLKLKNDIEHKRRLDEL